MKLAMIVGLFFGLLANALSASAYECGDFRDAIECANSLRQLTNLKGDNQNLLFNCTNRMEAALRQQRISNVKSAVKKQQLKQEVESLCGSLD